MSTTDRVIVAVPYVDSFRSRTPESLYQYNSIDDDCPCGASVTWHSRPAESYAYVTVSNVVPPDVSPECTVLLDCCVPV